MNLLVSLACAGMAVAGAAVLVSAARRGLERW